MTTIIQFTNENVSKDKKHRFLMEVAKQNKGTKMGIQDVRCPIYLTQILNSLN